MSDFQRARRRLLVLIAVLAGVVLSLVPAPAGARVVPMEWHRVFDNGTSLEHERLKCLTDGDWRCRYQNLPGPQFTKGTFTGIFTGTDVTGSWTCPDWLGEVCEDVVRVIAGYEQFYEPGTQRDPEFAAVQVELLVLADGDLWVTWIDSEFFGTFSCPWYTSLAEALQFPSDCRAPVDEP